MLHARRSASSWLVVGQALLLSAAAAAWGQGPSPRPSSLDGEGEQSAERTREIERTLPAEQVEFFERAVRPVLAANCWKCHGSEKQEAALRLDSRAAILAGGDSGPALQPGRPQASLLIDAVRHGELVQMPPEGKLAEGEIAALVKWVELGAPWPEHDAPPAGQAAVRPAPFDLAERARHWSFQPVVRPALPPVKNAAWPTSPIDTFLLAKLEAAGLSPAPPADRRTLLRRVTFDLIGLPPTPEEISAFLADDSPRAFERVVERLLDSPHHGERWARHWLDLVRYAETAGHEFDYDLPYAYEYRDYVIRAFNGDLPFNQFVVEHIAGDLLPEPRRHRGEGFNESIIGTGFWFLGESIHSPVDVRADEADRIDNQLDVFGKTFLGLTVACARCHDHKFDAITTRDYYALCGFLQSSRYDEAPIDDPARRREIAAELAGLAQGRAKLVPGRWAELGGTLADLEEYLVAAAAASGAAPGVALDPARLRRWSERLERARGNSSDPLHALAVLGGAPAQEFATAKQTVAARLEALQEASLRALPRTLAAFSGPDFGDWFVTGEAFGGGPTQDWQVLADPAGGRPPVLVPPGVVHSGLLAPRLEGTLRSPTFEITSPRIAYLVAGRGATLRLIIDGFQRIREPIYGGLSLGLDHGDELRWRVQDVSKWVGHRAYIELLDRGSGYAALERVVLASNEADWADDRFVAEVRTLLADPGPDSRETLAAAYAALLRSALETRGQAHDAPPENAGAANLLRSLLADLWQVEGPGADEAWSQLVQRQAALDAQISHGRKAMVMVDGTGENERVHIRGNTKNLGETVPRRFLEALPGGGEPLECAGSGRLELARRLASPSNPLLARVIVNRVWKHHFGTGLVATPDDFGHMGQPPSHPELLDWLAAEFVASGWSLKRLHRLLVLSSAYRMDSRGEAAAEAADPANRLVHRMNLRRLEAEAIRDALLTVSGQLDRTLYGPSVPPYLTEFMVGRGRPEHSGPLDGAGRRTLYLNVRRNFLSPLLLSFDYPQPFSTVGRRGSTNVPAQALALLNNPLVHEQARHWAERLVTTGPRDEHGRIERMYAEAFARRPAPEETASARAFLADRRDRGATETESWADLGHVLFNVKEFVFVR